MTHNWKILKWQHNRSHKIPCLLVGQAALVALGIYDSADSKNSVLGEHDVLLCTSNQMIWSFKIVL